MSTALQSADPELDLARLRADLDTIDDAIHDLLMRRAGTVAAIGALAAKGPVKLRPGREAAIIRRLIARHHGPLPARTIIRVWRELLAGTTAQQGPFTITVCAPEADPGITALARAHFGALTPLLIHRTPAQAIAEISAGRATAAILPTPAEGESRTEAWWLSLLPRDDPRLYVVARLPFWEPAAGSTAHSAAGLVLAAVPPDPSGDDITLLGLELPLDASRTRLAATLDEAGLAPRSLLLRRETGDAAYALVELAGFVAEGDARLAALASVLARPPVILGAYAAPLRESAR